MTTGSDNLFPKVIIRESADDGSDFSNPSADYRVLFIGEDGEIHLKDSAGTVTDFPPGGGSGISPTIFDAAGDIIYASAADTAARLAAGAAGTILTSAGTAAPVWAAPPQAAAYKRATGDYTTSSTSFVDVDGTNMSFTITTRARRVLIGFAGSWFLSSASTMAMDFTVDGTRVGGDLGLVVWNVNHAGNASPVTPTFLTDVLSAGSHTFKVQWRVTAGTGTIEGAATGGSFAQFYVVEQGS